MVKGNIMIDFCDLYFCYNNKYSTYKLLKGILKKNYNYNITKKSIMYGKCGKPYLKGIYFNISTTNNIILIAISSKNVGVDIESVSNLTIINDYLLSKTDLISKTLYNNTTIWCIKEAYSKYLGIGLKMNFNRVNIKDILKTNLCKIVENNKYSYCIVSKVKNINTIIIDEGKYDRNKCSYF